MKWSDKYNIGVREIDEQHQEIFRRLDWLVLAAADEEEEMLAYVSNFLSEHFRTEEKLMKTIEYDETDKHTFVHLAFEERVVWWRTVLGNNRHEKQIGMLKNEFAGFVAGWIIDHLLSVDMRLALAVKEFTRLALEGVDHKYLPKDEDGI
jgi:hemerythrin